MNWIIRMLMRLGLITRPFHVGRVALTGRKGVNHLTSHRDENKYPLDVLRRKLVFARQAGVQISRGPHVFPWQMRRDAHRPIDDASRIRTVFDMVRDAGIEPVPVVACPIDADWQDWRFHCRGVAELLHPHLHHVGIMNEPDNDPAWFPRRYAMYLRIAAEEFRAVNPNTLICAPSLGHGKFFTARRFFFALGPADFDVLTIHPYDRGWRYVNECLELVPDKPVWIEEDGATSWVTAHMRGSFHEYLAHPRIEAVLWYAFCNYDEPAAVNMLDYKMVGSVPVFSRRSAFHTFKEIR